MIKKIKNFEYFNYLIYMITNNEKCTFVINLLKPTGHVMHQQFNLLKPTGYVMHQTV
jgi:hypothetical protein